MIKNNALFKLVENIFLPLKFDNTSSFDILSAYLQLALAEPKNKKNLHTFAKSPTFD